MTRGSCFCAEIYTLVKFLLVKFLLFSRFLAFLAVLVNHWSFLVCIFLSCFAENLVELGFL